MKRCEMEITKNRKVGTMGGIYNHILQRVRVFARSATPPYGKSEYGMGWFHHWGIDFEEMCEVPSMQYSCAIIEMDSGEVVMPRADMIRFVRDNEEH